MGLFEKLGLVEAVPAENYGTVNETYSYEEEIVEAELESVNTETLIDDIYIQNNLGDKSRSIFKVEELIATLPKEMVTETKRNSVLAILGSFNLTATDVVADGEERTKILSVIKEQVNSESELSITDKEAQIEELKKSIAALTVEIADEQEKVRVSNETITAEVNKIEQLIKFVGGVN
jgi:ligand-binding sensor domain-containing protein